VEQRWHKFALGRLRRVFLREVHHNLATNNHNSTSTYATEPPEAHDDNTCINPHLIDAASPVGIIRTWNTGLPLSNIGGVILLLGGPRIEPWRVVLPPVLPFLIQSSNRDTTHSFSTTIPPTTVQCKAFYVTLRIPPTLATKTGGKLSLKYCNKVSTTPQSKGAVSHRKTKIRIPAAEDCGQ
jgi:hypothetical protein